MMMPPINESVGQFQRIPFLSGGASGEFDHFSP
jgi:hypothetical protein